MKKTFELVNIGGKHFIKRKGKGNWGMVVEDKTGALNLVPFTGKSFTQPELKEIQKLVQKRM